MGSLSVTWDEHYRAPFQPLIPGVSFAEASDPASLAALVDDTTAAIIVEPVQGEGGVRPIPAATIRRSPRPARERARCSSRTRSRADAAGPASSSDRRRLASHRI
jgi:acetylornithine/succinyldiaminopimelate/putrescine aminotransferase